MLIVVPVICWLHASVVSLYLLCFIGTTLGCKPLSCVPFAPFYRSHTWLQASQLSLYLLCFVGATLGCKPLSCIPLSAPFYTNHTCFKPLSCVPLSALFYTNHTCFMPLSCVPDLSPQCTRLSVYTTVFFANNFIYQTEDFPLSHYCITLCPVWWLFGGHNSFIWYTHSILDP